VGDARADPSRTTTTTPRFGCHAVNVSAIDKASRPRGSRPDVASYRPTTGQWPSYRLVTASGLDDHGSTSYDGYTIHHYLRDFGHDRVMRQHVYFREPAPNGHRNTLAMVTEVEVPRGRLWVTTPAFPGTRPSFGVQLGATVFNKRARH